MRRGEHGGFSVPMRVYWEDTDAAGIVFYANYLKFFERARTEWLRGLGFGQEALARATPASPSSSARRRCVIVCPARLDDVIDVSVDVVHLGQASLEIAQQARRADELLAEGTIRIGCVELGTFRPCRIPNDIRIVHSSMNQDFSIVTLVLHASIVVQVVMAGLMIASLASWTVIFGKLFGLRRIKTANDEFEREFWAGRNLNDLYADATKHVGDAPMERIFASGMREFFKLREKRVMDTGALLDGARRAMRASFQRELDAIESNLSFLASVGSVSPYVGLFGTVWGIMHAFIGLSNMTQVTLATVAPGIAEALVATAIGLFAAIPAVIAYNRFARDIDRIAGQLESFIEEFSNILQRNAGAMPAPVPAPSAAVR